MHSVPFEELFEFVTKVTRDFQQKIFQEFIFLVIDLLISDMMIHFIIFRTIDDRVYVRISKDF